MFLSSPSKITFYFACLSHPPGAYSLLWQFVIFKLFNSLFLIVCFSPGVFKMWRNDNTVHGITLPYPLCKQLLSTLISTTKKLSQSQRSLNGFHVRHNFIKMTLSICQLTYWKPPFLLSNISEKQKLSMKCVFTFKDLLSRTSPDRQKYTYIQSKNWGNLFSLSIFLNW